MAIAFLLAIHSGLFDLQIFEYPFLNEMNLNGVLQIGHIGLGCILLITQYANSTFPILGSVFLKYSLIATAITEGIALAF